MTNRTSRHDKAAPCLNQLMEGLGHIVAERVDSGRSTGIAAGVVLADRRTGVTTHGVAGPGSPVHEHTVFEIGSITKLFTATLLAEMAHHREVALDDPVARLLPHVALPATHPLQQITLEHLATHTSGLPSMPTNTTPADPRNPLADYTVADLDAFLTTYAGTRTPGARYEYSNLGMGLLGHALARQAHTGYEELLRERILDPLAMTHTGISVPADRNDLARGHDARGRPAPYHSLPTLAGAGALRSTVPDLLRFAAANLDHGGETLRQAMAQTRVPRRRTGFLTKTGLGWHILGTGPRSLLTHSGGTLGFSSCIALRPAHGLAVVVLSNSRRSSVEDIALHLLEPRLPLRPPPRPRREIPLPAQFLNRYTGTYDLNGATVTITRDHHGLLAHLPGEDPARLYPETRTSFFLKDMDAQAKFTRDPRRRVTGMVVTLDSQRFRAQKIG